RAAFAASRARRPLHPLPTRRSSDLRYEIPSCNLARWSRSTVRSPRSKPESKNWLHKLRFTRLESNNTDPFGVCPCVCDWVAYARSEEHTSELQSRANRVCRLLLEKQ